MWTCWNRTCSPYPNKASENSDKKKQRPIHVAFLRYTDKVKILSNAAARIKDNPFQGNLIGIGADFAKTTQERRKELVPYKNHIQKKMGQERKVFIAYPAILKYLDENGQENIVRNEEFKKMKSEMKKKGGKRSLWLKVYSRARFIELRTAELWHYRLGSNFLHNYIWLTKITIL